MKSFYTLFAVSVFVVFCWLEYRGTNLDSSHGLPSPKYYSYRGGPSGSGAVFYGSTSRGYYSHK
mgnify:CR=1 FL=1